MPTEMGRILEEEARQSGNPERALQAALYYSSAGNSERAKQALQQAATGLPNPAWSTMRRKLKSGQNPGLPNTWAYVVRLAANQVHALPGVIREIEKTPLFSEVMENAKKQLTQAHYVMQTGEPVGLDELGAMQHAYGAFRDFAEEKPDATVEQKEARFKKIIQAAYRDRLDLPKKNQSHDPRLVPYFARLSIKGLNEAVEGVKRMRGGLELTEFEKAMKGKAQEAHETAAAIIRSRIPELDATDARLLAAHLVVGIHQNAMAILAHAAWRKARQIESK